MPPRVRDGQGSGSHRGRCGGSRCWGEPGSVWAAVQLGPSSAIGIERALPPAAFSAALRTARGTATASLLLCSAVAGGFCPIRWCGCHLLRVERAVLRGSALRGAPGNECLGSPVWHPRALGRPTLVPVVPPASADVALTLALKAQAADTSLACIPFSPEDDAAPPPRCDLRSMEAAAGAVPPCPRRWPSAAWPPSLRQPPPAALCVAQTSARQSCGRPCPRLRWRSLSLSSPHAPASSSLWKCPHTSALFVPRCGRLTRFSVRPSVSLPTPVLARRPCHCGPSRCRGARSSRCSSAERVE